MSQEDENLDPLEILREDLEDDSVAVQLEAIRNLSIIALTLGEEQSRTKLVTQLQNYCFPVEVEAVRSAETYSNIKSLGAKEEVLREIALMLNGDMLPYLGGPEHCGSMLSLLQKLAMVEETVIREAAVNSILSCAKKMDKSLADKRVQPLVQQLSEEEWWTCRVSAASAGPRLYGLLKADGKKGAVVDMILKLAKDEMPMVRQEAYTAIPHMLQPMADEDPMTLVAFISPMLKNLSKELQENMRHRIVDIVKVLLGIGGPKITEICQDSLKTVIGDANWRVRKRFLDQLMDLINATDSKFVNEHILPGFCWRLGDAEPTVRVKAIQLLPKFLDHKNTSKEKVKELITMDIIRGLVKDEFPEVREATSGSLLSLFEHRGQLSEATKDEIFEFLKMFQIDENGDVRLNFCKGIGKAYNILGEQFFVKKLLPMVLKLQEDTKWRVRCGVIEAITILCQIDKNGNAEREKPWGGAAKALLGPFKDPVCAVRIKAIDQIPDVIDQMGGKWLLDNIFKKVIHDMWKQKTKYLLRIVPIRIGSKIAMHLNVAKGKDPLMDEAVQMICRGCTDAISNVRLVSARALIAYMDKGNYSTFLSDIQKTLEPMAKDQDEDVRFSGLQALRQANGT